MKIKGIFLGEDGSCGFKKGMAYVLSVEPLINEDTMLTRVRDVYAPTVRVCVYESALAFLTNWQIVEQSNTPKL